jgi:hypothetical protein
MAHLISETRQKTAKTNEAVLALEKHANYWQHTERRDPKCQNCK